MKPKRFPDPFALTTDPRSYVPRVSTERALREMEAEIAEGMPAVLLTGPPGIGKTLMLHVLGERLEEHFQPVYVPHGRLPSQELAAYLLGTLGVAPAQDPLAALRGLARSREQHRGQAGLRPLIVLIDDVGGSGIDALVTLTSDGFAPRLVAVPASDEDAGLLRRKLADGASLVSLREPLSAAESSALVRRRLVHAGLPGSVIGRYDEAAIGELHAAAEGNPMALHALADAWLRRRARPVRPVPADAAPEPVSPALAPREIARASHPPRVAENQRTPRVAATSLPSADRPPPSTPVEPDRPSPSPPVEPNRPTPSTRVEPDQPSPGTPLQSDRPSPGAPLEPVPPSPSLHVEPRTEPPALRAVPAVERVETLREPVAREARDLAPSRSSAEPPQEAPRPRAATASPGPPRVTAPLDRRRFEPRIRVRPRGGEPAARKSTAVFAVGLCASLALATWLVFGGGSEAPTAGVPDPQVALAGDPIEEPGLAEAATLEPSLAVEAAESELAATAAPTVPELAATAAPTVPETAVATAPTVPAPAVAAPAVVAAPAGDPPRTAAARFAPEPTAPPLPPVSAPPPSRPTRRDPRAATAAAIARPAPAEASIAEPPPSTPRVATAPATPSGEELSAVEADPSPRVARLAAESRPKPDRAELVATASTPEAARPAPAPQRRADPVPLVPSQELLQPDLEIVPPPPTEPIAAAPSIVRVHINATPWAEIELDGAAIGLTPLGNVEMTAGEHGFRAIFGDGRVIDRTLTVGAESRRVTFDQADAAAPPETD